MTATRVRATRSQVPGAPGRWSSNRRSRRRGALSGMATMANRHGSNGDDGSEVDGATARRRGHGRLAGLARMARVVADERRRRVRRPRPRGRCVRGRGGHLLCPLARPGDQRDQCAAARVTSWPTSPSPRRWQSPSPWPPTTLRSIDGRRRRHRRSGVGTSRHQFAAPGRTLRRRPTLAPTGRLVGGRRRGDAADAVRRRGRRRVVLGQVAVRGASVRDPGAPRRRRNSRSPSATTSCPTA